MTLNKIFLLSGFGLLLVARAGLALGQIQYVENAGWQGSFPIVRPGVAANLYVDTNDFAGVVRAAGDLQTDIARVTSLTPAITHAENGLGKTPSSSARLAKAGSLTA